MDNRQGRTGRKGKGLKKYHQCLGNIFSGLNLIKGFFYFKMQYMILYYVQHSEELVLETQETTIQLIQEEYAAYQEVLLTS